MTDMAADAIVVVVAVFFLTGATPRPWAFPISRRQIIAVAVQVDIERQEMEGAIHAATIS